MINSDKVIGYYTDVFGNEIDLYEQKSKYTLWYNAKLHEEDKEDGFNSIDYDRWEDAIENYNYMVAQGVPDVSLADNEYGVTLKDGEWW